MSNAKAKPAPAKEPASRAPRAITNFADLVAVSNVPKSVYFELGTEKLEIQLRALTYQEMQDANALTDVIPPMRMGSKTEFNYEDPNYQAAIRAGERQRIALMIELSTGITAPGATLAERADALGSRLPAPVVAMLRDEIEAISDRTIATAANFTSGDDSKNSPS